MPKAGEAKLLVPHDQGVVHVGTYVDEGPLSPSHSGASQRNRCTVKFAAIAAPA